MVKREIRGPRTSKLKARLVVDREWPRNTTPTIYSHNLSHSFSRHQAANLASLLSSLSRTKDTHTYTISRTRISLPSRSSEAISIYPIQHPIFLLPSSCLSSCRTLLSLLLPAPFDFFFLLCLIFALSLWLRVMMVHVYSLLASRSI